MSILKEMFKSKKFLASAMGVCAALANWAMGKMGLQVPEETVMQVLGMLAVYVLGQGVADLGGPKSPKLPPETPKL